MKKESLALSLKETLIEAIESWTDPEYGDSREPAEVIEMVFQRADEQLAAAKASIERDLYVGP